jgi:uncharacterized membrane protein
MAYDPRLLDMTPDGKFRPPQPKRGGLPLSTQIMIGAVLVAVIAGGLAVAAVFLWLAAALIPVALVAGLVGYLVIRFKIWQARRRGSVGRERVVVRWP